MQRPLNANRLRALVEHGLDNDHELDVLSAKQYLEKQNLSEGLFNLFAALEIFQTRLRILGRHWEDRKRGLDDWLIYFGNHPFNHLNVRPDRECQAFVKVHEDEREIQAFEILGNPEQSQAMLQWFWEYGNERLIR